MRVALEKIDRSNVEALTTIIYKFDDESFTSEVTYCFSYEELTSELHKRSVLKFHSWNFLVITFHLAADEVSKLFEISKNVILTKLIFTQQRLEIMTEDCSTVVIHYCCTLAEQFITTYLENDLSRSIGGLGVTLDINFSNIVNAQFGCLHSLFLVNSKCKDLFLAVMSLSRMYFINNVVDSLEFLDDTFRSSDCSVSFQNSTFGCSLITCYGDLSSILYENCLIKSKIEIAVDGSIGDISFQNCIVKADAIFNFEKNTVVERFYLELDNIPATLLLPCMSRMSEKAFDLPQSTKVNVSSFISPMLSEEEVCDLKRLRNVQDDLSGQYFREQEQLNRIGTNLERAYTLVKAANRQKESLDILERILIEKRKRLLLERKVEIAGNSQSGLLDKIKQAAKYFELNHLKSLAYDWVVGYFINLKKILRTFILVVVSFSTLFTFIPTLLKVGTNENGIDITLQQLPILDRIADSTYFTVVTLTTLGYGDMQPLGWGKLAASILALIGLLLSGTILAVILRRYSR